MYLDKKTKRTKLSRKTILFLVSILVVLAVLITGIIMLVTKGKEVEDSMLSMPFTSSDSYFAVGDTIVYADGELLTCTDSSLNTVWQLKLFSSDLNFESNDQIIAAVGENVIQVITTGGEHCFSTQLDGTVDSVRVGTDKVAVYVEQALTDETLSYIIIFDLEGSSIYQLDISDKYVLDYGFDSESELLYVLELDVSGAAPVSRVSTYRPETESMTRFKELKDQLIESVYIIDNAIYTIGTNRLTVYSSLNEVDREVLVYGWVLEDINVSSNPKFVFIPSTDAGDFIDIARIIRASGDETTINLPPNVFSILHMDEKIYCFATNNIFVYTSEGKYLRTYDLPFAVDGVERATDGSVFITQGDAVYLLPLL